MMLLDTKVENGRESRECLSQYTPRVMLIFRDWHMGDGIGEWLRVERVSKSVHPMSDVVA